MLDNLKMLRLYEKIFHYADERNGNVELDQYLIDGKDELEKLKKSVAEDMREHLEILEECCHDATKPPWCEFSDDGKTMAIMAAGRPFNVFKFEKPPKEADAHYLLLTQPHILEALIGRIRKLESLLAMEEEDRWASKLKVEDTHDPDQCCPKDD